MCILSISHDSYLWKDENRYIYPIDVDIWKYADDDETRIDIGMARCFYLDAERAMNDGEGSPDSYLDFDSGASVYKGHLYQADSYEYQERIQSLFPDALFHYNLLMIDRLEILPEHRGNRLSVKIIQELVARLGIGAGLAALKPFPLQFESTLSKAGPTTRFQELGLHVYQDGLVRSTSKLIELYQLAGFISLGKTGLMVACPVGLNISAIA